MENNPDITMTREMPHAIDSETLILGAILLDNGCMDQVHSLEPSDFYSLRCKEVFRIMESLRSRGNPIEIMAIVEELRNIRKLDMVGGVAGVMSLTTGLPHFSDISTYVEVVRQKSVRRRLIIAAESIANLGFSEDEDLTALLNEAEETIYSVSNSNSSASTEIETLGASMVGVIDRARALDQSDDEITGLRSHLTDLDSRMYGFQPSDLVILAARPSMGKTSLMLQCAANQAILDDKVVVVFSMEMSKEQLAARVLSLYTEIESRRIIQGRLSRSQYRTIDEFLERSINSRIFVDDTPAIDGAYKRKVIRRIENQVGRGIDAIYTDYAQLERSSSKAGNLREQVTYISQDAKALAKQFNVPHILISQLSRAPESRNPPRPMLSDLRESGSLEQDADSVIFIYREDYYKRHMADYVETHEAELIVAKNRNGPTFTTIARWDPEHTRFQNMSFTEDGGY